MKEYTTETVDEYLARGGKINVYPPFVSGLKEEDPFKAKCTQWEVIKNKRKRGLPQ